MSLDSQKRGHRFENASTGFIIEGVKSGDDRLKGVQLTRRRCGWTRLIRQCVLVWHEAILPQVADLTIARKSKYYTWF